MTTLITGATGTIGRSIVDDLIARGEAVRALSRDPDHADLPASVAVVGGSLAETPPEAFDDVESVFVFPADGVDVFVAQAVAAGISRFVVLSSLAVSERNARDGGSPTAAHHRAVERAVTSRAADHVILRPGNFAGNLLYWAFAIRSGGPVRMPYPDSSQVLIHEADVAAAAAAALAGPIDGPRILELTGPASLTKIAQLATISAAIGRDIPFEEIGPDEFRADMAAYMPADIVEMLLRYWSETRDVPETPLPAVSDVPRRTLAEWARDRKDAFMGPPPAQG